MTEQQQAAILAIIQRAIADGCVVSVYDGEDYVLEESRSSQEIIQEMDQYPEEWLMLYNNIGRNSVGSIFFVNNELTGYWGADLQQQSRVEEIVTGVKA